MYCSHKTFEKHCRWCGRAYYAGEPSCRDGFHSKACKQAHWRAYKKYVTLQAARPDLAAAPSVTPKKKKKRKR